MEKKSKKSLIIGVTSLLLVMLLLLGLTYAYYRTIIIGNNSNEPSISVTSKNMEVRYDGNDPVMNMSGLIEPGFEYTKTFTVTNKGDEKLSYAVYLEDVVNTFVNKGDVSLKVTCESNDGNDCDGLTTTYPEENTVLVRNTIEYNETKEVVHTYTVKVNYPNKEYDQSDDMGKKLEGKLQIYDESYVVDLVGTIADASDGDYVEINSTPKKSQIINGAYKLTAVEIGTHTLYVKDKDGVSKGSTTITINKGTEGVSGSTIIIDNYSQTAVLNIVKISSNLEIEATGIKEEITNTNPYSDRSLAYYIFDNDKIKKNLYDPIISGPETRELGMFSMEDDYGTSWYFRGAQENNYVSFADKLWRVVRINGDGTVRLILEGWIKGTATDTKAVYSTTDAYVDNAGVGYMYGAINSNDYTATHDNINSSNAKLNLDQFYKEVLESNYANYLSDTLFCGDKEMASNKLQKIDNTLKGYAKNVTYYAASERLTYREDGEDLLEANPMLKCANNATNDYSRYTKDAYQTSGTKVMTNGDLDYPIATISADEVVLAGGWNGAGNRGNSSYYLYLDELKEVGNVGWWTMTPKYYKSNKAYMFNSIESERFQNSLNTAAANTTSFLRPVINVSPFAKVTGGNGTESNPYTLGYGGTHIGGIN